MKMTTSDSTDDIREHGSCVNCGFDFNGDYIWDVGYRLAQAKGFTQEESEAEADTYASWYGAKRGEGRFSKRVGIYSMALDRTVAWQCPDCEHREPRELN